MAGVNRIPIIKLYGNLIASIQVALSDQLVQQLQTDVTDAIGKTSATGLVIDISGIDLMDSYISRAIRDTSLMARLMGVETVLCGLEPMIAMTLVEMGLDMKGVKSALNLEEAIELLAVAASQAGQRGGAEVGDEFDELELLAG